MAKTSAAPNTEILEAALQGLESQKQKIEEQITQVRSLMGRRVGRPPKQTGSSSSSPAKGASSSSGATRKKRVLSPEARKRIAAAQKKRWAAFRKNQE
ncbi:MAG: hypothetical protein JO340_13730 [Acidobacteriaceae bacterium]|nr:hypothetical protein [Acidobacteriaceae bacterium]